MKKNSETKKRNAKVQEGVLGPEDLRLWTEVSNSFIPLNKKTGNHPIVPEVNPAPEQQEQHKKLIRTIMDTAPIYNTPAMPEMKHGQAPGLDRRTQARMKRGKINVMAKIDLHGMYKEQAYTQLLSFLMRNYDQSRKTVLVITGKGSRRGGQMGVLREAVPGWLNSSPMRQYVHAFSHAAPKDGGEGALYVLLKKTNAP